MAMSQPAQMCDYLCDMTKHRFSFWREDAKTVCPDEEDIRGKVVIVTGSNTGIGKMIALQMTKRGAVVIIACRDVNKGQVAADEIKKKLNSLESVQIEVIKLDLGDLQSIRDFVKEFESKHDHLHILVNNAGLMDTNGKLVKTKDGFEQHIGVNHLGPFYLTRLLIPSLKKGSPSRIVCVASSNMAIATLDLDDLMMEKNVKTGDMGKEQYSISKLCNAICIRKFAETLGSEDGDIKVLQLCPGYVNSDVFRNEQGVFKTIAKTISLAFVGLSTHQGSETAVFCSVAKSVTDGVKAGKGEFYRFMKIWEKGDIILKEAVGSEKGQALYKMTEDLLGLN